MEALHRFELDLAVGGLTADSPWQGKVAHTRPFLDSRTLVGTPSGTPPLETVHGMRIAVRTGDAVAAYLERKGALALRVEDPFATGGPVAAPEWELEHRGFTPTGIELDRNRHVMATPPGENRFLMALERFLQGPLAQSELSRWRRP